MTRSQSSGRSVRLAGRDLGETLSDGAPALVETVLVSLAAELELYGSLPAEALTGDIAATVERNLRLFIDSLASGAPPASGQLDEIRHSAARRAEERIPLEVMLRGYPLAARVVYERATAEVVPDDADTLKDITVVLLRFLEEVMSAAAGGYLEEHQMITGAAQSNEDRFLDALLQGVPVPTRGELDPNVLPDAFDVFAINLATHPDELEPGVDAAIAARRKVRRVRNELRRRTGDRALCSLASHGGLALLPIDDGADAHDRSEDVAGLTAAAGVAVTAAVARGRSSHVPDAVQQAREVLQLVQWLGLPPSLYRLDDVLVEYQVTRPGPARVALASRLAPIAHDDALLATLRGYVTSGGNRRRVALDLHIHPNTVDYRMAKIRRLTGCDPTRPDDAYQLRTALIAHEAELATSDHGASRSRHDLGS